MIDAVQDRDSGGLDYLDMSVVSDIEVARALRSLLTEWRMRKRWDVFPAPARQLHRDILQSYIETGAPPKLGGLDGTLIDDLVERDLLVLRDGEISAAYPFSSSQTRHRVIINGREIFALCAIDALGSGAMVGRAAQVVSHCPTCEARIDVHLAERGLKVASSAPETARLWAGIVPIDGCAATSQCLAMLLFCSDDHLRRWQDGQPKPPEGYALSVEQAVQAGAAIFRPFLEPGQGESCA